MDALIMVDEIPDLGAIYRKDSGCRKSPRCLDCPLPECIYDKPPKPESHWYALRKADGRVRQLRRSKPSLGNRVARLTKHLTWCASGTAGQSSGRLRHETV